MAQDDERDLVRRCVKGDEEAWREFLKRYEPLMRKGIRLVFAAHRMLYVEDQLEDLYGAVLQRWTANRFQALRAFRWQSSLETYIVAVCRRAVIDALRRSWFRWSEGSLPLSEAHTLLSDAPEPSDSLQAEELHSRIREAFSRLDPLEQQVIKLICQEETSSRETARRLQRSRSQILRVLDRAKEKLDRLLRSVLCL